MKSVGFAGESFFLFLGMVLNVSISSASRHDPPSVWKLQHGAGHASLRLFPQPKSLVRRSWAMSWVKLPKVGVILDSTTFD